MLDTTTLTLTQSVPLDLIHLCVHYCLTLIEHINIEQELLHVTTLFYFCHVFRIAFDRYGKYTISLTYAMPEDSGIADVVQTSTAAEALLRG